MAEALIYHILGQSETEDKLEQEYKAAPYKCKRATYNLLRDYKQTSEYDQRTGLINNNFKDDEGDLCHDWLTPLPLSLLVLDKNEAIKYVDSIFKNTKSELSRFR